MYNVSPDPVRLALDDGTSGVFHLDGAEFFQETFQAEGTREGDDAVYRFVTSEDNDAVLVGRQRPGEEGWTTVGEVVDAEPVS
jgi:hypothetical protein